MEKFAFLNSFHSQSVPFLAEFEPEAIISFDSHLDDFIGAGPEGVNLVEKLDERDKHALMRSWVQWLLGSVCNSIPKFLVIPESCYLGHIHKEAILLGFNYQKDLDSVHNMKQLVFEKAFNTELFPCPPQNIKKLIKKVRDCKTAFDIDFDYVFEFKDYCFTKPPRFEEDKNNPSVFGSLNTIKKTIRKIKPNIITLSEVYPSEVKSQGVVKEFLNWLENRGYEVEIYQTFENDEEGIKAMQKADYFYNDVLPTVVDTTKKETKSLTNEDFAHKLQEVFLNELKKYYSIS